VVYSHHVGPANRKEGNLYCLLKTKMKRGKLRLEKVEETVSITKRLSPRVDGQKKEPGKRKELLKGAKERKRLNWPPKKGRLRTRKAGHI